MKLVPVSFLHLFNCVKELPSRDNFPFLKEISIEETNDIITFKINKLSGYEGFITNLEGVEFRKVKKRKRNNLYLPDRVRVVVSSKELLPVLNVVKLERSLK